MSDQNIIIGLGLHILIASIYSARIILGKSVLQKNQIPIIFMVPYFGVIGNLIVELLNKVDRHGKKTIGVERFGFHEDDIYWNAIEDISGEGAIIPLEEAITINDFDTRRKLILDTLFDDPMKYLGVLRMAIHNDDIETSHYATTTISNAQRYYQLKIQSISVDYENNPDDIEQLNMYIQALGDYINSGILEEYLLYRQQFLFSELLSKKIQLVETDKETWIKKLQISLDLAEYASAFEASYVLKQNWPDDEDIWYEAIRVCVEGHDRNKLEETLKEINKHNIKWTQKGRERMQIWNQVG